MIRKKIQTHGEGFYSLDKILEEVESDHCQKVTNGVLYCHLPHTSAGLVIQESYDPSARRDMENYLKHLAPRDLKFITHTAEGPDDSPSHMKALTVGEQKFFLIEEGKIQKGTWQGFYLAEFRDDPKSRQLWFQVIQER